MHDVYRKNWELSLLTELFPVCWFVASRAESVHQPPDCLHGPDRKLRSSWDGNKKIQLLQILKQYTLTCLLQLWEINMKQQIRLNQCNKVLFGFDIIKCFIFSAASGHACPTVLSLGSELVCNAVLYSGLWRYHCSRWGCWSVFTWTVFGKIFRLQMTVF